MSTLTFSSKVLTTMERSVSTACELISATWRNVSKTESTSRWLLTETEADEEASPPKLTMPRSIPPPVEPATEAVLEKAVPKSVLTLASVSVTRLTYEKKVERWLNRADVLVARRYRSYS